MKTRSRVRVPSKGIIPERSEPVTKLKVKKSSAQRVREHRERERQKPGNDHEKVKEETCRRVAAIRASQPKCPLGQKCKDQLCTSHPDRGRIRNLSKLSKLSKVNRALAQRRKNQRAQVQEKEVSIVLYMLDLGTEVL